MSAYERIEIGRRDDLGTYCFEPSGVDAFLRHFDPLAAREPPGGHVSPWHVAAAFMRLNVEFHRKGAEFAFGPSPGVSDLVWHRAVLAGETLRYTQTVTGKRRTARLAGWGLLTTHIEAHDETGDLVFSMTGRVLVRTD
ncbi:hypothetical protein [Aureimonas sp. AU20]|uniref:hypothetical protein n=1 Tax=Aureimonas sp. AU20 TaxID=1349819 RepID=UPI00071FFF71|nr:hypothetical protein [Aureimonas sp. AU20]ALN72741.1 hypothetical protein M673_08450 [Aureimonas sp. AU20]